MCGIFGLISKDGKIPDKDSIENAINQLKHRGPDDSGSFFEKNIVLGNRRLSILDLSDKGHQPMQYQGLTITYNGALYNYIELREELIGYGHRFTTNTDTEVILAAYLQWGKECVLRFNGMWAFAIYDPEDQILFCSRDRFGIKPFYYIWISETLAFASEIKAFTPLDLWQPTLNQEVVSDFLIKGLQNHTDQTLFKDVKQLLPGHHLVFDLKTHRFSITKYYDITTIKPDDQISFDRAAIEFRKLLKDAIRLHSRSDVKVGAALSGGLDSSSIVALQQEISDGQSNFEVVSYSSDVLQFDESKYVKSLVKRYPVGVHWARISFEEMIKKMDDVIRSQDEPLLSASLIAQYFVFKAAKKNNIKVMLDGQGADELLAGYGTYYLPYLKEIGINNIFKFSREMFGLLKKHQIKFSKKLSFFRQDTDYRQFIKLAESKPVLPPRGFRNYSNYMIQKGILPALLQFEDRNSMAHSVESRVPFLDYRLVEFCMSLPAGFKIRNGVRKAILREGMKNDLPKDILNRYDKMGFVTPQEYWINQHKKVIRETIKKISSSYSDVFDKKIAIFADEVLSKKQTRHYSFLWRVMTFERWINLYAVDI